jgi:ribosomal protein S18 acetylase RimI-like enzyme
MEFVCINQDEIGKHPLYVTYTESHGDDFFLSLVGDYFIFLVDGPVIIAGMGIISSGFPDFHIEHIIVPDENLRGKGYGSRLMLHFLREIQHERKDVQCRCAKENEEGRGLFEKFKFKPVTDDEGYHEDDLELKFKDFPHFTEESE